MPKGWLINDCLTCIPDTKTFWHDLLENIDGLKDKTFGYTPFSKLASKIERLLFWPKKPDYLIRNATFFRPLKTKVPQICLLQDYYSEEHFLKEQLPVVESCALTVINSPYIYDKVKEHVKNKNIKIIPMGVDFDFFNPETVTEANSAEIEVLPDSILFVGAPTDWPKGFDLLMKIVESTDYNFTFVMKEDYEIEHPRIKVFNKINQTKLKAIMKKCRLAVCTSKMETFHLAGIESCAMNLPVVATEVGIYTTLKDGGWGLKCTPDNIIEKIDYVYNNTDKFNPRKTLLNLKLDKTACMEEWNKAVKDVLKPKPDNTVNPDKQAYIIKEIIDSCKYKSYLELGLYDGLTFKLVTKNLEQCEGVDICYIPDMPEGTFYKMTTDEYFQQNKKTFDVIFIDACHEFKQVKIDLENALKILNPNGTIILHDTDPESPEYTQSGYCGDSYKMNAYLADREDLTFITLPVSICGLSIVRRKNDNRYNNFIKEETANVQ